MQNFEIRESSISKWKQPFFDSNFRSRVSARYISSSAEKKFHSWNFDNREMDEPKNAAAGEKQREKRLCEMLMPPPPNVPNANAKNSSQKAPQSRDAKSPHITLHLGRGEKTITPKWNWGDLRGNFGLIRWLRGVGWILILSPRPGGCVGWFWILATVFSFQKDEAETGQAETGHAETGQAD